MTERATANLPSRDLDRTAAFYGALGFAVAYRDEGWMILRRAGLELEFFRYDVDAKTSIASACLRADDLEVLHAAFATAAVPASPRGMPRLTPIEVQAHGIRLFALIDPDGNLLRCIDNHYSARGV